MSIKRKSTLGKGLEALLGAAHLMETPVKEPGVGLLEVAIQQLMPGRYQPRDAIKEEDVISLADSIRSQGVLQPILVKEQSKDQYEIIAGERRWRAAKLAGLETVPIIIKDVSDENALFIALIENIQRSDLNPMEEARALERMAREYNLTHGQIAEAIGKSRAAVTNALRLLSLSENVKRLLENKDLEVGHAKVLLGLSGEAQNEAAKSVIDRGLSVRETELLVAKMLERVSEEHHARHKEALDPDVQRLQNTLSDKLGASVEIVQGKNGKGKVVIHYHSLDELEGILAHVK